MEVSYLYQLGNGNMLVEKEGMLKIEHTGYPLPDCSYNGITNQIDIMSSLCGFPIYTSRVDFMKRVYEYLSTGSHSISEFVSWVSSECGDLSDPLYDREESDALLVDMMHFLGVEEKIDILKSYFRTRGIYCLGFADDKKFDGHSKEIMLEVSNNVTFADCKTMQELLSLGIRFYKDVYLDDTDRYNAYECKSLLHLFIDGEDSYIADYFDMKYVGTDVGESSDDGSDYWISEDTANENYYESRGVHATLDINSLNEVGITEADDEFSAEFVYEVVNHKVSLDASSSKDAFLLSRIDAIVNAGLYNETEVSHIQYTVVYDSDEQGC